MLSFLKKSEKTLSVLSFTAVVTTILWKTVGLGILPGFNAIWSSPQYPRRGQDDPWNLFYLALYGGIGLMGQWGSLRMALDESNRSNTATTRGRARAHGFFHVCMGLHHVAWSLWKDWGRLNLDRFQLPGSTLFLGLASLVCSQHGYQLLAVSEKDSFEAMVRHKTLLDMTSILSLIPMFAFLPANWVGYRNFAFERGVWVTTMTAPFALFAADFFQQRKEDHSKKA